MRPPGASVDGTPDEWRSRFEAVQAARRASAFHPLKIDGIGPPALIEFAYAVPTWSRKRTKGYRRKACNPLIFSW